MSNLWVHYKSLYKLVAGCDFLSRLIDAVKIRGGIDQDSLVSHTMMLANLPREARYKTGAYTLIEILLLSGIMEKKNNLLVVVRNPKIELAIEDVNQVTREEVDVLKIPKAVAINRQATVNISITISAQDLLNDAEGIGAAIGHLLDQLELKGD